MGNQEIYIYDCLILASILLGIIILAFILAIIQLQKKYKQLLIVKMHSKESVLKMDKKGLVSDLHNDLKINLLCAKNSMQLIENFHFVAANQKCNAIQYINNCLLILENVEQ